jgi:hypothetical protein
MNKAISYINYQFGSLVSMFLGMVVWMSLTTFIVVSKNALDKGVLPIFEVIVFVVSLLGVLASIYKLLSLRIAILLSFLTESILLIVLFAILMLWTTEVELIAYAIYAVISIQALFKYSIGETSRKFEDEFLISDAGKYLMRKVRNMTNMLILLGGAIGSLIALYALTFCDVVLVTFAIIMLFLNVLQNIWDFRLWFKFIRPLKDSEQEVVLVQTTETHIMLQVVNYENTIESLGDILRYDFETEGCGKDADGNEAIEMIESGIFKVKLIPLPGEIVSFRVNIIGTKSTSGFTKKFSYLIRDIE